MIETDHKKAENRRGVNEKFGFLWACGNKTVGVGFGTGFLNIS